MLEELLETQPQVISRSQAIIGGVSASKIKANIAAGRWQRIRPGIYAAFSGPLPRDATLAASYLHAGAGAALSHQTAAELAGLIDEPADPVHITIPAERRPRPASGIVYHRSHRVVEATHPSKWPPRTRVEDTIVDLIQASPTLERALGWITLGCGRRLTTPARLRDALGQRKKLRWRTQLAGVVADVESGCHSVLEWRYLRDVERAHGLPIGRRQVAVVRGNVKNYDDVRYDAYRTVVELDGLGAHPEESLGRDRRRDNSSVEQGDRVLRYGWPDVVPNPCPTAAQLAHILQTAGWQGTPTPCGRPACVLASHDHGLSGRRSNPESP